MQANLETLQKTLATLPHKPGVYQFIDKNSRVLYVGKAKDLKKRVSSYFQKHEALSKDKLALLLKINAVSHIITDTETEALLLESTLIKKYKPRYNVILRDDKYYQYIKITKEPWPRVLVVREAEPHDGFYFGPYTSGKAVKDMLFMLKRMYPYLTKAKPQSRPCLQYFLKRCTEPCIHTIERSAKNEEMRVRYLEIIKKIIQLLRGEYKSLTAELQKQMREASKNQRYEAAARHRDELAAIQNITRKQKVVFTKNEHQDIISLYLNTAVSAVNLFKIREGKLVYKESFALDHPKTARAEDIIAGFISQYYACASDIPRELILPVSLPKDFSGIQKLLPSVQKITVPQRGKKKRLVEMGEKNAEDFLNANSVEDRTPLGSLQKILAIKYPLKRIECYDISNLQGTNAVGAMAVFINGEPDKSEYRKFKIKYVKGQNDFAMLAEIVLRRFQHKEWPRPNLIVIDGGKGQLHTVSLALRRMCEEQKKGEGRHTGLPLNQIPIIALAKREEEIFTLNRKGAFHGTPIRLPHSSPALQLLQRLRDSAHRFALAYHRQKRSHTNYT